MEDSKPKMTLSDLANGAIDPRKPLPKLNVSEVTEIKDLSTVVQKSKSQQPVKGTGNQILDSAYEAIPNAIERIRQECEEKVIEGQVERAKEELEKETSVTIENDDSFDMTQQSNTNTTKQLFDDEDDLFDFDNIDDDDDILEQNFNNYERNVNTMMENMPTPTENKTEEVVIDGKTYIKKETKSLNFPKPTEQDMEKLSEVASQQYAEIINPATQSSIKEETNPIKTTNTNDLSIIADDNDFELLDDDNINVKIGGGVEYKKNEDEYKHKLDEFKNEIKDKINITNRPVNLTNFKFSKKAVSAEKVLQSINNSNVITADGVIYDAGKVIKMSAYEALEVQKLNPFKKDESNRFYTMRSKLETLYNHIIDPSKPSTFEAWLKVTPFEYINDYFFTAYKATYGNGNILTYNCNECNNVFLKEVPVMDMIKFKNSEIRDKYYDILNNGTPATSNELYKTGFYQLNDTYVVSLKHPMLYETVYEPSLIDKNYAEKYDDMLTLISYIDDMYIIDRENNELRIINYRASDPIKNIKRKIKVFYSVLNTLTSDQLHSFSAETDKYDLLNGKKVDEDDDTDDITYIIPECTCPKCGAVIKEDVEMPETMLFSRHQLAAYQRV